MDPTDGDGCGPPIAGSNEGQAPVPPLPCSPAVSCPWSLFASNLSSIPAALVTGSMLIMPLQCVEMCMRLVHEW